MAKELPYFQFEPAEYLTGDIQFCTFELQGVFINICALYWQRSCELTREQIERKFDKKFIEELINEGILKFSDGIVSIEFLDRQFESITNKKIILSEAGRKGAEIKKQATLKPPLSEASTTLKHLDKIREDNINISSLRSEKFEKFWAYYKKGSKKVSKERFMKLTDKDLELINKHLPVYFKNNPEVKFRKDAERYLSNRLWDNGIEEEVKPIKKSRYDKPHPDLPEDWWTAQLTPEQQLLIPSNILAAKIESGNAEIRKQMGI